MLESNEMKDAYFKIGNDVVSAHRAILKLRASTLSDLAENTSELAPVVLTDVDPIAFRGMLHYAYVEELPPTVDILKMGRSLLDHADRFGCISLKLYVESVLVTNRTSTITVDNVAEWILFADAKSCALLKEAACRFFTSHSTLVMSTAGWNQVSESAPILAELWKLMSNNKESGYDRMSVTGLRKALEEKGLGVDGSREILFQRLQSEKTKARGLTEKT